MILVFIVILFGLSVGPADAQSLPERYMVTGVAADDVLNIRADRTAASDKIGTLGPFTLNVEVQRQLDGWGFVGAGENSGWVSMRFLAPNPVPANEIPRPLRCLGTEPFWNVTFWPRGAEFTALGQQRQSLTILHEAVARNGYIIEAREGPTLTRTLTVNALSCSDGMSDRTYGMSVTMFTEAPDGNSVLNGCCTMQVN